MIYGIGTDVLKVERVEQTWSASVITSCDPVAG